MPARWVEKIAQQRREGLSDGLRPGFRLRRLRPQQTDRSQTAQNHTCESRICTRTPPEIATPISDDIVHNIIGIQDAPHAV
jgi:hypothetical protein